MTTEYTLTGIKLIDDAFCHGCPMCNVDITVGWFKCTKLNEVCHKNLSRPSNCPLVKGKKRE